MSAYGAALHVNKSGPPLPTTRWIAQDKVNRSPISINLYHLTLDMASKSPGLVDYLHSVFARIVEEGKTYPMEVAEGEKYSKQAFENYFFAADVIVGVLADEGSEDGVNVDRRDGVSIVSGTNGPFDPSVLSTDGQPPVWKDRIAGFYYVGFPFLLSYVRGTQHQRFERYFQIKPNYPGRSSHVRHLFFPRIHTSLS